MEGPTSEPMWGPWCPAQGLAWSGPPARLRASGLGIQGNPREQLLISLPVLAFQGGQGLGHPEQAGPSGQAAWFHFPAQPLNHLCGPCNCHLVALFLESVFLMCKMGMICVSASLGACAGSNVSC